ncbi:MAG: YhcH/YjgK/YiaL family protein [Acidobacteriaceae bacterium]|jgi:YhcH/YjgK/YiaL family protein|nr:YhcH/YjgK/YiaL family protein [Acidobacteriaceae bacterium]
MILDELAHAEQYDALGPLFRVAFAFLRRHDLASLAPGRHALMGDDVCAMVADYETKPRARVPFEAHRRHIDVQAVVSGAECMGVAPLDAIDREPYDEEKDVLFGAGRGEYFALWPGRFAILFPHDAHAPGVAIDDVPMSVRKIVIKIRRHE